MCQILLCDDWVQKSAQAMILKGFLRFPRPRIPCSQCVLTNRFVMIGWVHPSAQASDGMKDLFLSLFLSFHPSFSLTILNCKNINCKNICVCELWWNLQSILLLPSQRHTTTTLLLYSCFDSSSLASKRNNSESGEREHILRSELGDGEIQRVCFFAVRFPPSSRTHHHSLRIQQFFCI